MRVRARGGGGHKQRRFKRGGIRLHCLLCREASGEALPLAEKAYSLAPWNALSIAVLAAALRRSGDSIRAEEVLQPLRDVPQAYGAPRGLAFFHLFFGEFGQAAQWLERSIEQRDPYASIWFAFFPAFRSSEHSPKLAKMTRGTVTSSFLCNFWRTRSESGILVLVGRTITPASISENLNERETNNQMADELKLLLGVDGR